MVYTCSICKCSFQTKQHYNDHMLSVKHRLRADKTVDLFSCETCGKQYMYKSGLSIHKKKCMNKEQINSLVENQKRLERHNEELMQEREFLRKQVEDLYDKFEQLNPTPVVQPLVQNNNTTNTTNNNNCIENQTNNNLHVHINSFGNENLDYITNDFIHGCVNRIYESVPTILQKMHFDPEHPENHNFKIPNKKLPHASVMSEDQKWKLMDRQEAINNMIDKGYNIIDSQFREDPSKFSESKRRHYRRFQENYDTEDKDTMKRIRSDVELVVLNGTREIHNKPAALKGST